MSNYRIEKDYMGEIKILKNNLWGIQTQRAIKFFNISTEKIPNNFLLSLVLLKKFAAKTNSYLNLIDKKKALAIIKASDEILIDKKHFKEFPIVIWQSGSGTQMNMNINEVIANRASEIIYGNFGFIHPNDDVNKNQSTNDIFLTAMNITAVNSLKNNLIPQLKQLAKILNKKSNKFKKIIKIGRTHLQDAVPLTMGQEISGWSNMIINHIKNINSNIRFLLELPIGGTAVGNGINVHPKYSIYMIKEISSFTTNKFTISKNKFSAISSCDAIVKSHGTLKALSVSLMKISNDIKLLASGPKCGFSEILIPENEPGSSIMPGKINPSQCEAINMLCCQVLGNDVSINIGGSLGNLQLNTFRPMIIYNYLQSVRLLSDGIKSFIKYCIMGIKPNKEKISKFVNNSLMLATILNKYIGYDKASKISRKAYKENITLKDAALNLQYLTEEEFTNLVKPENMIN